MRLETPVSPPALSRPGGRGSHTLGARRLALAHQQCRLDQPALAQLARALRTGVQRPLHLRRGQHGHFDCHLDSAQIAVILQAAGRAAHDAWVFDIHRVGNHRRRGVGARGIGGEHRHTVGDAERKTAAAPAAGGNAAHARGRAHFESPIEHRLAPGCSRRPCDIGHHAHAQCVAGREVQRDIAAVVDEGAVDAVALVEGDELLRHRARHCGHRRDEALAVGVAGPPHAPRYRARQGAWLVAHRLAQQRQLGHQLA